ncbi:hypothetical protein ONA92_03985 [Mycobacteroides salmoniphilum]|uniref:hypothetical protein n=1 Tax=Mycobacteroides salmoniphilum TaxID=404941 RepID=UPI003569542A
MAGSGPPPGEFRWIEADEASTVSVSSTPHRRWQWVGLVLVVIVVMAGAVVGLRWWGLRGAGGHPTVGEASIGTPKDRLIGFALDRQPVPAWQVSQADIGLPPQVRVGEMFAALGDTAYFVAGTGCAENCVDPKGWVYGLDFKTGKKVLGPIELKGFWGGNDCYSNGLSVAVCVTPKCDVIGCDDKVTKELAWVIDLDRGEITFTGEPGVHVESPDHPELPSLRVIGSSGGETRLVGVLKGKGVYGVGSHLEPTWFLPGSGNVPLASTRVSDAAPVTLGTQMSESSIGQGLRVFSADGKDLTPPPREGLNVDSNAQIYPGGFAVEYRKGARLGGVSLFNTEGKELAHLSEARFLKASDAMPIVQSGGHTEVYTPAGKPLMPTIAGDRYRAIGTTLYVNVGADGKPDAQRWESVDLLTGQRGPGCSLDLNLDYVGSDGSTLVWHDINNKAYTAVDSATCRTQWMIQDNSGTPAYTTLVKAGTGLLQETADTITGLRAPG